MSLDRLTQITSSGISSVSTITVSAISGNITATTATVSGNLSGNTASFSGNLSGNTASFSGNLSGNTASFSGNITGTAASFSSNVNIAGILTCEDITNVDSIGVITARSGIVVSAGSTTAPSISPSGDSNTGIFFPSADTVCIGEGGTEVLRVNSSGNIGIGTNNPGDKLQVNTSNGGGIRISDGSVTGIFGSGSGPVTRLYSITNHDLILGTNDIERVRVDTSGRVRMPYQPSFNVSHSDNTLTTGDIVWGNTIFNTGNYYNTANGRFTAPVSGVYYFRAHTLIQNAPGGEARIALYKNGSGYGGLRFITVKPANGWWTLMCQGHIFLSVNEYVTVRMEQNPSTLYNDSGYNSFTGHLVG